MVEFLVSWAFAIAAAILMLALPAIAYVRGCWAAAAIMVVGCALAFSNLMIAADVLPLSQVEMPMGALRTIEPRTVLAPDGQIYVLGQGSGYKRIQRYSPEGAFQRGWMVERFDYAPTKAKSGGLGLTSSGTIVYLGADAHVYDTDGQRVAELGPIRVEGGKRLIPDLELEQPVRVHRPRNRGSLIWVLPTMPAAISISMLGFLLFRFQRDRLRGFPPDHSLWS